jgi:hypothetical protein
VHTFDLDIVPARAAENVAKLLRVLAAGSPGHHNLTTGCGPLDVWGTIGRGLGYEDLLPHTTEMEAGGGVRVRVLNLATIIALQEERAGEAHAGAAAARSGVSRG